MATLSVVVAAHNVSEYLGGCLESVLATGTGADDIQVVVVDDASTDETGWICDWYAGSDTRVDVVRLPANVGLGEARNIGLGRASGDYVWFVDGDDRVAAIDSVRQAITTLRPDVLLIGHALLYPDGTVAADGLIGQRYRPGGRPARQIPATLAARLDLVSVRQAAWNRIVRRGWLAEMGLRFPVGWYEDVGFSHLTVARAATIATLDHICYHYRQRPHGAITSTASPRHFDVFAQYEALFEELDRAAGQVDGGDSPDSMRTNDAVRARLFRAMIDHYLVIAGTPGRLPAQLRRRFFAQMAEHYHRYRPPRGYQWPSGINGVKHRFVGRNAYRLYAATRGMYRAARRY